MPSNQNTIVLPLSEPSFKSYVIRALIDWCEDEGLTPYMLVAVDDATRVPREFVNKDGTIVFCVHPEATHNFELTREGVRFQARFGEQVRDIDIPLGRIAAVYPKEDTNKVSYFPILETPADFGRAEKPDDSDDDIPTFTKL